MSLSRHRYGEVTSFFIQQAWDASIVRSDDGGRTWSAQPPLGGAMFPGQTFATPFFVDYGRDGGALPDEAVDFVYAVSSLGVWNNGSSLALGRVPRTRIGRLAAVDWEFVQGFRDGKPVWSTNHHAAAYVHRDPGRLSMNGMAYIAGLGGYLLPQWHYIYSDETLRLTKWLQFLEHTPTRLSFSFSEHPWGPWRPIGEHVSALEGWYNPAVVSKFSSADGLNLSLFVSGLARSRDSYPEGIEYYPTLSERYSRREEECGGRCDFMRPPDQAAWDRRAECVRATGSKIIDRRVVARHAPHHLGIRGARGDRVHSNTARGNFEPEHPVGLSHPRLGGRVCSLLEPGHSGRDRCDAHNRAAASTYHVLSESLCAVKRSDEVHREHALEFGSLECEAIAGVEDASRDDEVFDLAALLSKCLDRTLIVDVDGGTTVNSCARSLKLRGRCLGERLVEVADDDLGHPRHLSQLFGDRESNPTRAADDDCPRRLVICTKRRHVDSFYSFTPQLAWPIVKVDGL
jgi:hypothetical protein